MRFIKLNLFIIVLILAQLNAKGQLFDDFSDGDFTNNPTWVGSESLFVVENEVLRSNSSEAADYYLSTPNELMDETRWRFYINLNFSPSSVSYVDIFLVADNSDLTAVQNGYFLRFGGTPKEISLFRRLNGTNTLIIDGEDLVLNSANNKLDMEITRSPDGNWQVKYDKNQTGTFVSGGSVVDNEITTTSHFGIFIRQSAAASHVNGHFFDNFIIEVIPPDLTPPSIIGGVASSSTELEISFSEPLDQASAENVANFEALGSLINIVSAQLHPDDPTTVNLTLSDPIPNGETITIAVTNVEDLVGNAMDTETIDILYFVSDIAEHKDLVFNELMADPNPPIGLPEQEFIEIYNASDKIFDMKNWVLVNTTTARTLTSSVIFPGEYLILCHADHAPLFEEFGTVIGIPSFVVLANAADSLTLINPQGDIIDIVSYKDSWYNDTDKANGGYSLELINPYTPCSGKTNWTASNDQSGGTPGAQNSVFDDTPDTTPPLVESFQIINPQLLQINFNESMNVNSLADGTYTWNMGVENTGIIPLSSTMGVQLSLNIPLEIGIEYILQISNVTDCIGNPVADNTEIQIVIGAQPEKYDILISEIMADPSPSVGLPEGEYFELYNASNKPIELQGLKLNAKSFVNQRIIFPGEYVLCIDANLAAEFSEYDNPYLITGLGLTYFTNGGRDVLLFNASNEEIDRANYNLTWYNDVTKQDGGYSLERINLAEPCRGGDNWSASVHPLGGTPGAENSVFDDTPDTAPPIVKSYEVLNPELVQINFNKTMDLNSLETGVYDWNLGLENINISVLSSMMGVQLSLNIALEIGNEYILQISDVADCTGNTIAENTEVKILIGLQPEKYDILISEIMADPSPSVGLPEGEYFELYNASDKPIELQGLQLNTKLFVNPRIIFPGEYILCIDANLKEEFSGYEDPYLIPSLGLTYFTNGGRDISLFNANNEEIDRANYHLSWYKDVSKQDGGYSLERINLAEPCRAGDNWSASIDPNGGTPGMINSVNDDTPDTTPPVATNVYVNDATHLELLFSEPLDELSVLTAVIEIHPELPILDVSMIEPDLISVGITLGEPLQPGVFYTLTVSGFADCTGNVNSEEEVLNFGLPQTAEVGDILVNEVLFNPRTGGAEFVEIVNVSDKVIGLQDWALQNKSGTTRIISTKPVVIFPDEYMVLTDNARNIAQEYPFGRPENYFQMESIPAFNNTSGSVVILNAQSKEMDRLDYLESYHFALLKTFKGVSLERISFTRPTNDERNWTSAAEIVGFATPGYQNSQYNKDGIARTRFAFENEVFSPDNDGFEDQLILNYSMETPGYVATIEIYDRRGRLQKTLENNTLLATTGVISWDGVTDEGIKTRIGPHIYVIQLFNLEGDTEVIKLPCIVAGKLSN